MYTILNKEDNKDTNNNTTVVTQTTAAATTGSMIRSMYAATTATTIPAKVMATINQLLANQAAIMQQMESFGGPPGVHTGIVDGLLSNKALVKTCTSPLIKRLCRQRRTPVKQSRQHY